MKSWYLLAIPALFISSCSSYASKTYDSTPLNDLKQAKLKGNVKSITITTSRGTMTSNGFRKDNIEDIEIDEYNKAGFLTQKTFRLPSGINQSIEYKRYDNKNQILVSERMNAGGNLIEKIEYEYNDKGQNAKRVLYEGNDFIRGSVVTKFDSIGRVGEEDIMPGRTTVAAYLPKLLEKASYHYAYDSKNNMTGLYYKINSDRAYVLWFTYSNKNEMLTKTYINSSDTVYTIGFSYNEKGDLTLEKRRCSNKQSSGCSYEKRYSNYEYDNKSNYTKVVFVEKKLFREVYYMIEREITYY